MKREIKREGREIEGEREEESDKDKERERVSERGR